MALVGTSASNASIVLCSSRLVQSICRSGERDGCAITVEATLPRGCTCTYALRVPVGVSFAMLSVKDCGGCVVRYTQAYSATDKARL